MDHDLTNQKARQLHGIHWQLCATQALQPTIRSSSM
jgi:hypothetical protein